MVRFFISIDGILFNFISTLYDLLIAISRTSILTQGDIAQFAARIEILLGIFMLFKLSFSLITYIVNPDDFSDKSKGFGKLIQNSVISLVLLVTTPYIFQMAFNLQAKILDDNTLAKLLLGEKLMSDEEVTDDNTSKLSIIDTAGERMAFQVMLPFFMPRTSLDGLDVCVNLYDGDVFNNECYQAMLNLVNSSGSDDENDESNNNPENENENEEDEGNDSTDGESTDLGQYIKNYKYGVEVGSLGLTFRSTVALITIGEDKNEQFLIDYKYILSTATAVIVCLLLITFCIDIGLRSVKLAFLQLIYPIPVISYMDPSSAKDGMFTKWYKMCLSTFLSLFIRLLALYFGIYIISKVGGMYDVINGSQITNGWVQIFIIVGILMFVKQMPKILENLGIKIDGDGKFNLNPLKKVFDENNGVIGAKGIKRAGVAAGAAGLAGAAAMGTNGLLAAQRIKEAEGLKGKAGAFFRGLGSTLAGGASAGRRGLVGGLKGEKFGKTYASSYGGAMTARTNRSDRKELGVNAFDVAGENLKKSMHIANESQKYESELKHLDEMIQSGSAAKKRAEGEVDKKLSMLETSFKDHTGNIRTANLGALKNKVDVLKNTDTKGMSTADIEDLSKEIADAESDFFVARKKVVGIYTKNADNLHAATGVTGFDKAFDSSDTIVSSNINNMSNLNETYGMGFNINSGNIGETIQSAEDRQAVIKNSESYRKTNLISQQAQKEKNS